MKAVANATPLIALSLVDGLDLLSRVFGEVLVPRAVYDEVIVHGSGRPGNLALTQADWIQVVTVADGPTIEPLLLGLDPGEMQVLLLARSVQADWVLIDERLGRRVAGAMGLPVKGTMGILLAGYHAGLLSRAQALGFARRMTAQGIRIHPRVITWLESELDTSRASA